MKLKLKELYKNNKKLALSGITISASFVITVILPLIVYLQTLNLNINPDVNIDVYINRIEKNTQRLIAVGVVITSLFVISYLFRPISIYKLSISIIIKALYLLCIIITSNSEIFEISAAYIYLRIDLSFLNLFLLPLPIIFIVRTILKYIYDRREIICILIILEIIQRNKLNSKDKIRKHIIKHKNTSQNIRSYLLKNFEQIMINLETHHSEPLISNNNNSCRVSRTGLKLLKRYGRIDFEDERVYQEQVLDSLEVWTEAGLEKLARERRTENNKKTKRKKK